jgi:hypothetical protein
VLEPLLIMTKNLGLNLQHFTPAVVTATRADGVAGLEFLAVGAGDEVGGSKGVVTAASVAARFRGFLFGHWVLCHDCYSYFLLAHPFLSAKPQEYSRFLEGM